MLAVAARKPGFVKTSETAKTLVNLFAFLQPTAAISL